jgi:hypothetical protein
MRLPHRLMPRPRRLPVSSHRRHPMERRKAPQHQRIKPPMRHIGKLKPSFLVSLILINNCRSTLMYRASFGYDVNSTEFKEWQASQQQQYAQYYASQGYTAPTESESAPQPGEMAPPPPPHT